MKILEISFWKDAIWLGITSAYEVVKWMIPAIIIVKILELIGGAEFLAELFEPIMRLIGLPGWTSIVWTTAILSNVYAALVVLFASDGFSSLSAAQMSILGVVMLMAHSLIIEARITQAFGVRFWHIIAIRLGVAFIVGFSLNLIYGSMGVLQSEAVLLWEPSVSASQEQTFMQGLADDFRSLVVLSIVVAVLVVFMQFLKEINLVHYCELLLKPALRIIGISPGLTHIVAVGGLLGLTYGSGLLIAEHKQNQFAKKDLAVAVVFISLSHALIEDSLVLMLIGSHISAILIARLAFTFLVTALLMRWSYAKFFRFYA